MGATVSQSHGVKVVTGFDLVNVHVAKDAKDRVTGMWNKRTIYIRVRLRQSMSRYRFSSSLPVVFLFLFLKFLSHLTFFKHLFPFFIFQAAQFHLSQVCVVEKGKLGQLLEWIECEPTVFSICWVKSMIAVICPHLSCDGLRTFVRRRSFSLDGKIEKLRIIFFRTFSNAVLFLNCFQSRCWGGCSHLVGKCLWTTSSTGLSNISFLSTTYSLNFLSPYRVIQFSVLMHHRTQDYTFVGFLQDLNI